MSKMNQTVLLVEDEKSMQTLFGFALKKAGFEVINASNGRDALEVLSKLKPDAIISDIMMPELDGFEFREILKMNKELYEIPFLFLSAFNNENNIIKGIGLDADDFIPKTDGALVVVNKLQNVLRKRDALQSKMRDEMAEASRVTGMMMNAEGVPEIEGYQIESYQKNHEGVPGGDFIDISKVGNKTLAAVGDVMGKRWEAWVYAHAYTAYVRSSIRSLIADASDVDMISTSGIMNKLNRMVYNDEQVSQTTCALTLMLLDPETNTLSVTNTLQYPLLLYRSITEQVIEIQPDTKDIIGLKPESNFVEVNLKLESGDAIISFTDGLSEALGKSGQTDGFLLLQTTIEEMFAKQIYDINKIVKAFINRTGSEKFKDDATMLMIRKK